MTKLKPHIVAPENAAKILEWLRTRGGIAIWYSADLSNPGQSWTTPRLTTDGMPMPKPSWQAENEPERLIMDTAEVVVQTAKEVARFHVALRTGSQGMSLKVTNGGTRRIRAAVSKFGPDAWYEFDYGTQEAVILVPDVTVPLKEWAAKQETPV